MDQFESLIIEHIPRLRRYARALTGNAPHADDLVQECLARALDRRRLWVPAKGMRGWLLTILHNLYVNDLVRSQRDPIVHGREPTDAVAPARADSGVLLRDLDRALASLSVEQREVVLLVGLEQLSYRETATVLAIPIGTVMSRLSRGRELLRAALGDASSRAGITRVK